MNELRKKIIEILKNEKGELCHRQSDLDIDPSLAANEILIAMANWLASDERDQAILDAEADFEKFAKPMNMNNEPLLRACAINSKLAILLNRP